MGIKEDIEKIHKEIHKVILSAKYDKYKVVPYIARWAAELKYKEEYKDLLDSERLNIAIYDVLTGRVSIDDIKKLGPLETRKKLGFLLQSVGVTEEKEEDSEKTSEKKSKKKK
ncbi:MAG: hypothetical protein RMJ67_00320 [Elusimicrobiota bacterium]|nr:hypothetical protein [Endomicrobiia bacterium]MCX7910592.1 hypothetical protein [Endomicrobiia bacterium]MDW8164945.1 hypothetical protein [Elusimicrobiota bacterium]